MMEVFKYRSNYERDLLTLANNQIYAPTYDNLNDPFEGIINTLEDEKILQFLKNFDSTGNLQSAYQDIVEMLTKVGGFFFEGKDALN